MSNNSERSHKDNFVAKLQELVNNEFSTQQERLGAAGALLLNVMLEGEPSKLALSYPFADGDGGIVLHAQLQLLSVEDLIEQLGKCKQIDICHMSSKVH